MQISSPSRFMRIRNLLAAGTLTGVFALTSALLQAQQRPAARGGAGGHPNQGAAQSRPGPRPQNEGNQGQGARNQVHLSEWMNRHRDQPITEQQRALEKEPGFHELPQQTQQRFRDRLTQLNNMPADKRNLILQRNEALERLSPAQRQQVLGSIRQLGAFPEDRRHAVARALRDLRSMPEEQRQQYLSSPAYYSRYSEQERGTIGNLLTFEPVPAAQRLNGAPPQ